jgi:GcrA cell cycle regulator
LGCGGSDDSEAYKSRSGSDEPTWTVERVELLKSRFEAGLSCREIANDIGVSRNAVIGKLSRLNLAREKAAMPCANAPKGHRPRTAPRLRYQMPEIVRRAAACR